MENDSGRIIVLAKMCWWANANWHAENNVWFEFDWFFIAVQTEMFVIADFLTNFHQTANYTCNNPLTHIKANWIFSSLWISIEFVPN